MPSRIDYRSQRVRKKNLKSRFKGRARLVENMPGFVRLENLRPLKSDYYIVLTHWNDEASFHAWTESQEFKEAHRNRPRAEIFPAPTSSKWTKIIQSAEKDAGSESLEKITAETQRGKAATETRNISRKDAKHVLSNVEGAAKVGKNE